MQGRSTRRRPGSGRLGAGLLAALGLGLAVASAADVLETRDGRLLQGTYRGGTQATLRFETNGTVQVVAVEDVLALTFGARRLVPDAPPAAPATPAPAASAPIAPTPPPDPSTASRAVVPAGMHLQIRIQQGIDPATATTGDRFQGVLESSLMAGDTPIVPPGAPVQGRVAEIRSSGPEESRIQLELDTLVFRDEPVVIVTGPHRLAAPPAAAPAVPASLPETAQALADRTAIRTGSLLEFRLLQPVELRLR